MTTPAHSPSGRGASRASRAHAHRRGHARHSAFAEAPGRSSICQGRSHTRRRIPRVLRRSAVHALALTSPTSLIRLIAAISRSTLQAERVVSRPRSVIFESRSAPFWSLLRRGMVGGVAGSGAGNRAHEQEQRLGVDHMEQFRIDAGVGRDARFLHRVDRKAGFAQTAEDGGQRPSI